ncbi:DUF262 domain-containing protein [Asticcacaulis sp.]|uniref:GmrSD restriction endonuclease domain-containing protein n=1 Tax=Asticcacaulis sp. TaxID=1872648 RepID=UPI002637F9FA|nr:DUF262 domain-containing protein [Asticcacaulis sp.]
MSLPTSFDMEDENAPLDQQEDETDLASEELGDLNSAVLYNTDWTVGTILDQMRRNLIRVNPQFQRRNAWDEVRKSRLIESLMLGLPVPNIVLAEAHDENGRHFLVIDGKQRLLSIADFQSQDNPLTLRDLTISRELEGFNYERIQSDVFLAKKLPAYENQPIRTIVIRNWPSERFLYTIFYRLNSGSLPLSPQELRKALHPGKFLDYLEEYISRSNLLSGLFSMQAPDRRMRDAELVLRFIAFDLFYPEKYGSSFKNFMDNAVKYFNDDWNNRQQEADRCLSRLETAVTNTVIVFGERDAFKKWNGSTYERRVNRAVFDAVARYFCEDGLRDVLQEKKEDIQSEFKRICAEDENFRRSIEQTTKTPIATATRIDSWGLALSAILGREFTPPTRRLK